MLAMLEKKDISTYNNPTFSVSHDLPVMFHYEEYLP